MGNDKLLDIAKKAAIDAGKAILNVYHSGDFHVEPKNDNSPLTKADKQAHNIIINYLKTTNIPILSEEGHEIPYTERKKWKRFWLVDPLDGTKEFIKRNGEFTVNIALIEFGQPILGVVYIPVSQKLYWALKGHGAYRKDIDGYLIRLVRQRKKGDVVRVIASRSHINKETQDFINRFEEVKVVSRGSSLKFLEIAENTADFYPRFAPTMEWDTGAAQAILEEAGGKVLNQVTKKPLSYNKENLLNPYFLAE
ncbi:MAG TPA: 3'(2'),5'-bisphosphate nucleotidase [Bacteroidetes bacterium]|nr:3'(2'),5'-bisphosphate nucleotidase [Bacteroidota bacterium]